MFENSQIRAKGHAKGLITDGKDYPENSVQDVLNLDLNLTWDERRTPYADKSGFDDTDIPTLSETINSANYKVLGIYEKNLVDYQGNERDVVIVVLKHTVNFNIKIFVNRFYNPTTDFGNSHDGDLGWIDSWTELTEAYHYNNITYPLEYATTSSNPVINRYIVNGTGSHPAYMVGKPEDYFNGWFLYSPSGVCIGQIVKFDPQGGSVYWIDIGMNSILNGSTAEVYPGTAGGHTLTEDITDYYICRFPLNSFAFNQINNISSDNTFEDIEEIDFEETYNSVKICIGNGFRPVRITFLQNKLFWKADQIDAFKRSWDGFWMSYDIPKIDNIGTVVKYEGGTGIGDHAYDSSVIGKEIGLRLTMEFDKENVSEDYWKDNVVAIACTLDGYQTVFLKYFIGGKFDNSIGHAVYILRPEVHLLVDFDRRITDVNYFGDSPNTTSTIATNNFTELISYQFAVDSGGIVKTDVFIKSGTLNYYRALFPYTWIFIYVNDDTISIMKSAIGIALNSVLNSKYYHTPVSAFRFMFRIGNNIVGADLSADYLETSSRLKDNYGYSKIVISQIQYQGTDGTPVNADSCFGEERIRHLIQGERLTAGTGTIGNRFLLFTSKNLFYYDLDDEQKLRIRENFEKYLYKGTYGLKTVCKAQVGGQFAGVYWLANDSIYRFLDNQPEDILFNRWKETYQEMSESDKSAAVTGFNALTKDVYFKIGTKVYIWNILTEGWKIYSYYDVPECMFTANSGDLYFTKGQYIFKTEPYTTELRTDQSSAGPKSIPFYLRKRLTHGSQVINKIPDRVDMIFEVESPDESDELLTLPANLTVQIGKHGSATDILSKLFSVAGKFKRSFLTALRVRANYYDVKLMSDPLTEENILRFKLHELIANAKIGARDLTKI